MYKLATVQTAQGPRAAAVIGEQVYDVAALTGQAKYATVQDVLDHMVLVDPGETYRDSVTISGGANQSLYRINTWLLDETGTPQPGNPVFSNTFDVFPGANATLVR